MTEKPVKYRFQQILDDGTKIGNYYSSNPTDIAKKMAKKIYDARGYEGNKTFTFYFVRNRPLSQGGDIQYQYTARVSMLKEPIEHKIGNSVFYTRYKCHVKQTK